MGEVSERRKRRRRRVGEGAMGEKSTIALV